MKKYTPEKEEYELLPHKEVEELKEELRKLKEFELTPTKKLEVSVIELNKKLDRLIDIFEKASVDLKEEEGGLTFKERIRPVVDKMNKILEQNAEIASGILAIADLLKGKVEPEDSLKGLVPPPKPPQPQSNFSNPPAPFPPPHNLQRGQLPPARPLPPPGVNIRMPVQPQPNAAPQAQGLPPPPPPKKRTFGL
ncbi:hypothetical protein DRJ25_03420 [Candidatus Woesearchaeota archaeon]|nr:MAG: hypothetical protein DRJ25_03420 [Candidatus Woesearchaeota archaeon]